MYNLYIGLKVNAWIVDKDLFSAFTMSSVYQCDLLMSYNVLVVPNYVIMSYMCFGDVITPNLGS
jgi:hypothetical protein